MKYSKRIGILLAFTAIACTDATSPLKLHSVKSIQSEPLASLEVRGESYGPNGEFLTPGADASQRTDTVSFSGLPPIDVYITTYTFALNEPPGGQIYNGGRVFIAGEINNESQSIGFFDADFSMEGHIFAFPQSGTLTFGIQTNAGCHFSNWFIDGVGRIDEYPLVRVAADLNNKFVHAIFICD
jgi:hypothetical protein